MILFTCTAPTSARYLPGIPLRDLTADDLATAPAWLIDSLAASDLYQATPDGLPWLAARAGAPADHTPEEAP